ncbi:hypothetical protein [Castellaniella sp.]|uniref:hypothetical protein n=1 Tax=Castellaniella sp. TaxID=1955812 RepID=UPI002AFFD532|nr:hypothetical protein [Castellaniella sp.]
MRAPSPFRSLTHLSIVLAASLPLAAQAGGTAQVQAGGQLTQLAWQTDGAVRLGQDQRPDYLIVRDGKAYSVSMRGQTPVVMEVGGLLQGLGALAQSRPNQYLPERVDQVQDTGRTETVAGITGHVYRLTVTDTQGRTHPSDAVLTADRRVVDMTASYLASMQLLLGQAKTRQLTGALPADRRGILRLGQDFVVQSISGQEPPASEFTLPAQPTSLQNLLQGLQGLQKQ